MEIEEVEYEKVLALRQEVMYPDRDIDFARVEKDHLGIHIGIREKGILVSVVSIFLEGRDVQFRKLATKFEYQNRGYASALVKWIITYAKEMKLNKVWANSRVNIYPLYEHLGFEKTGETFEKNGYEYVIVAYKIQNGANLH